ncbi:SPOR domain-containing protein [Bartonella alsatica]|uniref:SPOR domain-containing protein n=2 Tax=Bartonella alsatica TaxID=52764 RepID=J0YMH5_9HYPH|nr:SPOR domain-containing protein [Bartonella alsatica]EJF75833.1 hypothetical protein MEC_00388 [Bartonella alsatica IBS 382]QLC51519.1 SPOR domain-containing protein [Bartonella alsatica]
MSDNDRKNPYEMKQDHKHHDPLERLTRIFNPHKQREHQNDQSISPVPKTSSYDDVDLSFLEAELKSNLTNDLPFEDKKKQWNLHATSEQSTSNIAPTSSLNHLEKNNSLSKDANSSPISHDEEQILDALSPLPIQKKQSPQNITTLINTDSFFEKSDFSEQSDNLFFDETNKHANKKDRTESINQSRSSLLTTSLEEDIVNIQQNHDDNQNFNDTSVNHPYKVLADQENQAKEYYTDVFLPSTDMFPSSSDLIPEKEDIGRNETIRDLPLPSDSTQIGNQSDLKGFPQERHPIDYPQFYEEKSLQQETYTEKTPKYRDAQAQYINNTENISEQNDKKEVPHIQNNLNNIRSSSETLTTKQANSFFAHNYPRKNTPPPNVDTYKFAEEIVEKTGPIMVPEVPYEAPEYDVPTDDLKEEFADVLNVGNVSEENFLRQQQQNEIFNEIFHQTMQTPKDDAYTNSQAQQANYFSTDNRDYYSSSFTENSLYKDADQISTHPPSTPPLKSFIVGKTLAKSAIFLTLIAIGFVGYSHFFMQSQKNESAPIIYADHTPFKFKQETAETKNDVAHNLDIYKQKTEQNEKQENTQQFLIDNSEQPEDLEEVNQREATSLSSPSLDESDIEDAVTEAINHTIPMREVQTVIVNQDGTIVLTPKQHTERKTIDEQKERIDQADVDQLQDFSTVSSHEFDINNKKTEDNLTSDIDKIIAESASTSNIEEKIIPIPSHAERNSEKQIHTASRVTQPSPIITQNSESYYVQLASQPTHALARDSLKKMKFRFGSLIGVRPLNIQSALIPGKGTYYRVRIQTENRNDAITLCESIKNSGGDCFITR